MTVASALTALNQDITAARTAITNKGGTVTSGGGSSQLATDIATIPTGGSAPVITSLNVTPTTSAQTITAPSGTDGYSPVNVAAVTATIDANIQAGNIKKDVQILGVTGTYEGSGGSSTKYGASIDNFLGDIDANDQLLAPTGQVDLVFTGVRTLGISALNCGLAGVNVNSASFPDLTEIDNTDAMIYCFRDSTIKSASFPELTRICKGFGHSFYSSPVETISFPKLTTIIGGSQDYGMHYAFYSSNITSIEFPKLTTLEGASHCFTQAFYSCSSLTTVSFPKLETIPTKNNSSSSNFNSCFNGCTKLTNIYFNALKTTSFTGGYTYVFNSMFSSISGRTNGCTVHFPSNLSSTISALNGYPTFGGNANYISIAFDLPATS